MKSVMNRRLKKKMLILLFIITVLIVAKITWVSCATSNHGSFDGEKKEIIRRANYLTSMVCTTPQDLLNEMPSGIDVRKNSGIIKGVGDDDILRPLGYYIA